MAWDFNRLWGHAHEPISWRMPAGKDDFHPRHDGFHPVPDSTAEAIRQRRGAGAGILQEKVK